MHAKFCCVVSLSTHWEKERFATKKKLTCYHLLGIFAGYEKKVR